MNEDESMKTLFHRRECVSTATKRTMQEQHVYKSAVYVPDVLYVESISVPISVCVRVCLCLCRSVSGGAP